MRALVVVALAGCSQWFGLDHPEHTTDAMSVIDGAPLCLGAGEFEVCLDSAPTTPLNLDGTLDTAGPMCPPFKTSNGTSVCVLAGSRVTVTNMFRAEGPLPIVVFAVGDLSIGGTLDVASHRGNAKGAGGNAPSCPMLSDGDVKVGCGAGGAGGSFGTLGGHGGAGAQGQANGAPAVAIVVSETLHGGCAGSRGGDGATASNPPGDGGGAVYLLAGASITITGTVNASGAGGSGGVPGKGGGGGGGSGGMILLHAPTIAFSGTLMANGGGGGGGADTGAGGNPGSDASDVNQPAPGGFGGGATSCGATPGCGGTGAVLSNPGAAGGDDGTSAGGGGGGGGVGVIRVLSGQTLTGMISPPPTMM